jgi:hypothetical protein
MKQVDFKRMDSPRDFADTLAARGIVDAAFPTFLAASGVPAFILGPADHMAVAAALCDDPQIGTPIAVR